MHLAYVTIGNEVRLAVYRTEPTDIVVNYVRPGGPKTLRGKFKALAPRILVGPAMEKQRGFSLQSEGPVTEFQGSCKGKFEDGRLVISESRGIFKGSRGPTELSERRTIEVEENRYSIELPATDIILLSKVFDSYEKRRQYFALLRPPEGEKKSVRVSGWSMERGGIVAPLCCALAVIATGEHAGWVGFVLFSRGNGGIALGGAEGVGEPWALLESYDRLPQKIRDEVLSPPDVIGHLSKRDTDSLAGRR